MPDDAALVAGVELGGTKCICCLASGPDNVVAEQRIPTSTPSETLGAIQDVIGRWQAQYGVTAIGVTSFGPLELDARAKSYGRILETPKPGWSQVDVLGWAAPFGVPTVLDTDVNGAACAEEHWGAVRGLRNFCYVTVGTGIGVGTIVNGRPVRGLGHSEAGHLRVGRLHGDSWAGACPYHGDCVEGLASGTAIKARSGLPAEDLSPTDPVWDGVAHALAGMAHNLVLTTAPERIVIGGGVASGQPHLLVRIRKRLVDSLGGYAVADRIAMRIDDYVVEPGLGVRAGPLGAVAIAMQTADGNW